LKYEPNKKNADELCPIGALLLLRASGFWTTAAARLHLLTCVCAIPSELLECDLLSPISVRYFPLQPPAQNNVFFGWMIPAGAALLHLHIAACRQMDTSWLRFVLH